MVSKPLRSALLRKIVAKDVAIMTRKPLSRSAQTACSREDPQPKLAPVRRIEAPEKPASFSTNAEFRVRALGSSYRQGANSPSESPDLDTLRISREGIIVSVLILSRTNGAVMPVCWIKGVMLWCPRPNGPHRRLRRRSADWRCVCAPPTPADPQNYG